MPDPGARLIEGFNAGLNIRRNWEETAKLVRERELQEDADRQWKEAMAKQAPVIDAMRHKQAAEANLKRRMAAGYEAKPGELELIKQEAAGLTGDYLQLLQAQSVEMMISGNPVAMGRSQEMLKQASDMFIGIGDLQERALRRLSDESEGGLNRGVDRERLQVQRDQIAAEKSEGAENRALQRERIQADLKVQGLDESPAGKMKQLLFLKEGVSSLRGSGMTNEQIDQKMGEGFSSASLEEKWKHLSDETEAELKHAEGVLRRLEERSEKDEDVSNLIEAQKEEIAEILKQADAINDSKIIQKRYERNTPMARRAARTFFETVTGGVKGALELMDLPHEIAKAQAEAGGLDMENYLKPGEAPAEKPAKTRGSSREFEAPPPDFERPVAYPDEDGTYSQDVGDF